MMAFFGFTYTKDQKEEVLFIMKMMAFHMIINQALFWSSGSSNLSSLTKQTHAIDVPASGTSTIVFTAGSVKPSADPGGTRTVFLGFTDGSLALPTGLEYADDLDTATAYFDAN